MAIIRALSNDARRNFVQVSKELGLSTRTVRNQVAKLREERAVFTVPSLNYGVIPGLIPVYLSYSYSRDGEKRPVDSAMVSHFETSYFATGFTDPDSGFIVLNASTMNEVLDHLEWARSLSGVLNARTDLLVRTLMFPEKVVDLLNERDAKLAPSKKPIY